MLFDPILDYLGLTDTTQKYKLVIFLVIIDQCYFFLLKLARKN